MAGPLPAAEATAYSARLDERQLGMDQIDCGTFPSR